MTEPPQIPLPIRTERLILREFDPGDFAAVHAYGSDPQVTRYMRWGPNTEADTHEALARAVANQDERPRTEYNLAIVDPHRALVIGSVGLHPFDPANRTMETGYCLRPDAWGHGFASEASRALVGAAFAALHLHRVIATCDARNLASAHVLEKLGMRREGHFRRDLEIRGAWRDSFFYAVLADEWRAAA
jgi:RimJ/RimL family protein N-acetyltransferase